MMRSLLSLLLCCMLSPTLYAAEQIATTLQQSTLRAEPFSDAREVATLQARQQVTVLGRKGGWYQVRSGGRNGWLRMSQIRLGDGSRSSADGNSLAETLRFLSTGRSGASGVTVATGIRGLDSADITNATPNHRAIGQLNRYTVSSGVVHQFARSAKLKSQPLGYIDKP